MARIRTIKPEFFTSEDIVALDPMARILYIALWCEADREGRFSWKPNTFKMRYFPADKCNINTLCDAIVTRGLVSLYGDGLAFIPSFKSHQHINPRESASVLPDPLSALPRVSDASAPVQAPSVTHREEGKEGKECISATSAEKPKKEKSHIEILVELGVDPIAAKDWLKVRKEKRAAFTETALGELQREATRAGISIADAVLVCAKKGWQGFNAGWDWKSVLPERPHDQKEFMRSIGAIP